MPNKDRQGKWQPFDALEGYKDSLKKVEYEKDKMAKPIIYPDQLEEMNEILISAYECHNRVIIRFYHNGYIYEKEGLINKIDSVNKTIVLNNNLIKLNMIIDIRKL